MLDILKNALFPKLFFSFAEGGGAASAGTGGGEGGSAAAGAAGGDGGAGGGGSEGGAAGAGEGGKSQDDGKSAAPSMPEGFSAERWEKVKDVDPDLWAKVKGIDPEKHAKASSFYEKVAGDQALFEKVTKIIDEHAKAFSNPELQRVSAELKQMRDYIEGEKRVKAEQEEARYKEQFERDLDKARDEIFKELKVESVLDFDKELVKEEVLRAYAQDQSQKEPKLTIKDLKALVTAAAKKVDTYRREILKASVKKDDSPEPIKDGKTAGKKDERDLRSKDSRVEDGQRFLQTAQT